MVTGHTADQPGAAEASAASGGAHACRDAARREAEFFDALVDRHGDFNPFADRGWRTLARRFEEMVRPTEPVTLLDVGCGTGRSRELYARHARHYVGIDLAAAALRAACRGTAGAGGTAWVRADASALPFADGSFDVVAFSSVLHHVPDYVVPLREAVRVLRPGGRVFAFDPNALHPAMALFRLPGSPLYVRDGVSPDERPLRPAALRSAFAAAGLVDVRQRCQSDIPYRRVAPRGMNLFLSAFNACDWAWEHVGLGRWFGTFVVTSGRRAPIATGLQQSL